MPQSVPVEYLLNGLITAAVAAAAFIMRTHWKRTDDHDERLRKLEENRVTQADVARIYDRIEKLGTQVSDQHREVLNTLIKWNQGSP